MAAEVHEGRTPETAQHPWLQNQEVSATRLNFCSEGCNGLIGQT